MARTRSRLEALAARTGRTRWTAPAADQAPDELAELTYNQLRQRAAQAGIATTGKRPELEQRLRDHQEA